MWPHVCIKAYSRVFAVTVTETMCVFVVADRVFPVVVASQVVAEQVGVGVVVEARRLNKRVPKGLVAVEKVP